MQTTSTNIRQQRTAKAITQGQANFLTRQAQVAAIMETIFRDGTPETHDDSTATCTHFKLRRGQVGLEQAEAQVYRHAAGTVIRYWVYTGDFGVKVRDLVLLPCEGKGYDLWLDADGRLFPHEGKYAVAGQQVMMNAAIGR